MSSTDVSRAYKNFRSDPLDWPLLAFQWRGSFYCDVSMPFGTRASSCHMQRVANAIVRMLKDCDVIAKMYIDDLILISPSREKAARDLEIAQSLLKELGLPEAPDKVQQPSTKVTCLGVEIDSVSMSISVPQQKLEEIKVCVSKAVKLKSMSKKHLQSVIGKVIHVAKCIRPARLFVSRLLEALRGMKNKRYIKVSKEMRDDFIWFQEFSSQWNGVGLINCSIPDMNHIILDCARSIWMLQALLDVQISYQHIAGCKNVFADALSRRHTSQKYEAIVSKECHDNKLSLIEPCLYLFKVLNPPIFSRTGIRIAPTQGRKQTAENSGSGNSHQS